MLKTCKMNKEEVIKAIEEGNIDAGDVSFPDFIDGIILKMAEMDLLILFEDVIEDKRSKRNSQIPLSTFFTLTASAKMKLMTSLTDISYAITDPDTLAELGWNIYDTTRDLENGLISDGAIRALLNHYKAGNFVNLYNNYYIVSSEKLDFVPNIHILDCTKVDVNVDNENYENSSVIKDDGELRRGYKIASLRGLLDYSGIIEEIEIGTMKTHDLALSRDILLNSPALKPGDILIEDRGFISREIINHLKTKREVDIYIPVRKNMHIYTKAVAIAKSQNKWYRHPNKKRKYQEVASVRGLG